MSKNARLRIYIGLRVLSKLLPLTLFIVITASLTNAQTKGAVFPKISSLGPTTSFRMIGSSGSGSTPRRRTFEIFKPAVNFRGSLSGQRFLGVDNGTSSFVPVFDAVMAKVNINSPSAGSFWLKHSSASNGYLFLLSVGLRRGINTTANRFVETFSSAGLFAGITSQLTNRGSFASDSTPSFNLLASNRIAQFTPIFQLYRPKILQAKIPNLVAARLIGPNEAADLN
jgi:hypothetical protein